MKFVATPIDGVVAIELEPHADERGSFARLFAAEEFAPSGMMQRIAHVNLSRNPHVHTLRGLHLQADPLPDPKVVRCVAGAMFDVAVDVRRSSPTRGCWFGIRLDAETGTALHIPAGCAHGFLTLEPATDVLYLMGAEYEPTLATGWRWDDPAFRIAWPGEPALISDRDASYPDFA